MMTSSVDLPVLLESFKWTLHAEDASRNTTSAYLSDLAHFVSWYAQTIGAFKIDEITPTDIRAYREFLQEHIPPTAPATINRRLAGLDEITPHTLRHTFARVLLMAGTQLTDVADLLGHSSLDTTRIYTRASDITVRVLPVPVAMTSKALRFFFCSKVSHTRRIASC
jgi:site-specific recombinase XerD